MPVLFEHQHRPQEHKHRKEPDDWLYQDVSIPFLKVSNRWEVLLASFLSLYGMAIPVLIAAFLFELAKGHLFFTRCQVEIFVPMFTFIWMLFGWLFTLTGTIIFAVKSYKRTGSRSLAIGNFIAAWLGVALLFAAMFLFQYAFFWGPGPSCPR